ncbi:hypothetical protein [Marinobacterium jannaschii]|uniref:hypothetical protein n=1 Tax=Marinobacterium jannaschii TaxID=64970 RepID=UPI000B22E769|nr:hypothetical protein [Marinobacterium jannaschii]
MRAAKRVTGHDYIELKDSYFDTLELQYLLGLFAPKLSKISSKKNVDNVISDTNTCLLIRYFSKISRRPLLADDISFSDIVSLVQRKARYIPFPASYEYFGILLGKQESSIRRYEQGATLIPAVRRAQTIIAALLTEKGTIETWITCLEQEAACRGLKMDDLIDKRGWPTPVSDHNRITGQHILNLRDSELYDYLDLQFLLGLYMPKIRQFTSVPTEPINDVLTCLLIRYLLITMDEEQRSVPPAERRTISQLPDPLEYRDFEASYVSRAATLPRYLHEGVLLGRAYTTVIRLRRGKKIVPAIQRTIQLLNTMSKKEFSIWISCIEEEAASRNISLEKLAEAKGWPDTE